MRRRTRLPCWALAGALSGSILFASSLAAQIRIPRPGPLGAMRVRVAYPGMGRQVGTLVSMDRDTLVARWESGLLSSMAISRITDLDMSHGRLPRPKYGAKIGAGIGLVGGLALSIATGRGADVTAGVTLLGMSVGSLVWTLRPGDTWRHELGSGHSGWTSWRAGVVSSPRGGGTRAGLSHAF